MIEIFNYQFSITNEFSIFKFNNLNLFGNWKLEIGNWSESD